MASYAENVSIWWHHYALTILQLPGQSVWQSIALYPGLANFFFRLVEIGFELMLFVYEWRQLKFCSHMGHWSRHSFRTTTRQGLCNSLSLQNLCTSAILKVVVTVVVWTWLVQICIATITYGSLVRHMCEGQGDGCCMKFFWWPGCWAQDSSPSHQTRLFISLLWFTPLSFIVRGMLFSQLAWPLECWCPCSTPCSQNCPERWMCL